MNRNQHRRIGITTALLGVALYTVGIAAPSMASGISNSEPVSSHAQEAIVLLDASTDTCPPLPDVRATDITESGATIIWTTGNPNPFTGFTVDANGHPQTYEAIDSTTFTSTVDGFAPGSEIQVFIFTECTTGTSNAGSVIFTTLGESGVGTEGTSHTAASATATGSSEGVTASATASTFSGVSSGANSAGIAASNGSSAAATETGTSSGISAAASGLTGTTNATTGSGLADTGAESAPLLLLGATLALVGLGLFGTRTHKRAGRK